MLTKQDILNLGWTEAKFKNNYYIELNAGKDTVQDWLLNENNGGPEYTIKSKLSDKFATHAEVNYFGDIKDAKSLRFLMDLLGIRPIPPEETLLAKIEALPRYRYQDNNTMVTDTNGRWLYFDDVLKLLQ